MKSSAHSARPSRLSTGLGLIAFFQTALITWWGYSLYEKHVALHDQQILSVSSPLSSHQRQKIDNDLSKHVTMIVSEGVTLWALMMVCLFWVYRLLARERYRNDELKSLFALWTHECKTPIASIQLQAEALEMGSNANDKQRIYLSRIVADCLRLQSFVDRILQIVRTQSTPRLVVTPGLISDDVEQWWNYQGRSLYGSRLEIDFRVPAISGYRESEALAHILSNLFENASKYAPNSTVIIAGEESTSHSKLIISNSGPEFSQSDLAKLGTMFFRGNQGVGQKSGSGIGLFLVQRLMQKMGGYARFYNFNHQPHIELAFKRCATERTKKIGILHEVDGHA